MKTVGFNNFNKFKTNIKELKQFYDLTSHLYNEEHARIEKIRGQKEVKNDGSLMTTTGLVNHSVNSLYYATKDKYPNKLRQLILISSITTLEVYLTDLIIEIFERNQDPFLEQTPVEFMKNMILSTSDINYLHKDLIERDRRKLTSGGFTDITKYYKSKFKVDFRSFEVPISKVEEIHIRRHIHVHRNGVCDKAYAKKYPSSGYKFGSKINIDNDYIIFALNTLSDFGAELNKKILDLFPHHSKGIKHFYGSMSVNPEGEVQKLLIKITLKKKTFEIIEFLKSLIHKKTKFEDYIVQITQRGIHCNVIVQGNKFELKKYFTQLKFQSEFDLMNVIELKI